MTTTSSASSTRNVLSNNRSVLGIWRGNARENWGVFTIVEQSGLLLDVENIYCVEFDNPLSIMHHDRRK
ncbi:hypothetical protein C8R48DRAFT_691915 [Suillus tomentosus]|nr:hypothetical protein C8R48DRAFT_691915 [Suillus tomentosus]